MKKQYKFSIWYVLLENEKIEGTELKALMDETSTPPAESGKKGA